VGGSRRVLPERSGASLRALLREDPTARRQRKRRRSGEDDAQRNANRAGHDESRAQPDQIDERCRSQRPEGERERCDALERAEDPGAVSGIEENASSLASEI